MGKLLGPELEAYLEKDMRSAKNRNGNFVGYPASSGLSYTFSIVSEWKQIDTDSAYYCEAYRYIFLTEESKYVLDEETVYYLYSPADLNSEPTDYGKGDTVRAIYNGNWEIVGATGGTPRQTAIVIEAIAPGQAGRVKIYGKPYPDKDENGDPIEPVYDLCICDELAGAQNEHPEKLLPGTVIADLRGPFSRPKPGGEDGETEEIYAAVNTEGVYTGILSSYLYGVGAESTIQVADSNGVLYTLTVRERNICANGYPWYEYYSLL